MPSPRPSPIVKASHVTGDHSSHHARMDQALIHIRSARHKGGSWPPAATRGSLTQRRLSPTRGKGEDLQSECGIFLTPHQAFGCKQLKKVEHLWLSCGSCFGRIIVLKRQHACCLGCLGPCPFRGSERLVAHVAAPPALGGSPGGIGGSRHAVTPQ